MTSDSANKTNTDATVPMVSGRDLLLLVLNLPSTDPEELEGMVQLQGEDFSPYPPERTLIRWEALQRGATHTLTLLAICNRQLLDPLAEMARENRKALPLRVDVDLLVCLDAVRSLAVFSADRTHWNLLILDSTVHAVAWHEEAPVLFRTLGEVASLDADLLREELEFALLSLETAFPPAQPEELRVWHSGSVPEWLPGSVGDLPVECHSLPDAGGLADAARARARRSDTINLAPEGWAREEADTRQRRQLTRTALWGLGVWMVFMLVLLGWSESRRFSVRRAERANQSQQPAVRRVQSLAGQVRSISQFTDRSSSALETLLILAEAAPGRSGLLIDDFDYRKQDGIRFSGRLGTNIQPFYQFLENLAGDSRLRVENYNLREARDAFTFSVDAVWEWMAAAEAETEGLE